MRRADPRRGRQRWRRDRLLFRVGAEPAALQLDEHEVNERLAVRMRRAYGEVEQRARASDVTARRGV
jgi:hypothetical protein